MPNFAYTARDSAGQSTSGTLAAESLTEASQLLRAEGKYPIHIQPTHAHIAPVNGGIRIPRADVIQIATQLAIMVETGVTIVEALECVASSSRPQVKKLVNDLSQQVQGGIDFSSALSRHPRSFPQLFVAMIRASEKSGMLPKMLQRGTAYLRDEQEIVRKVRGALTYPSIMFSFAIITTVFLLIFVLPQFTAIYANKKAVLPTPTRVLMFLSDGLLNNWMWIVPSILSAIAGLVSFFKFTTIGRQVFFTLQIRLPLIGSMFRQLNLARGLRMMGTMAGSGVHLMDCVTTAKDLTHNTHFQKLWQQVEDQLQMGKQLSDPLFNSPLVPRAFAQMIQSAEKSGKLATVMEQVATFSEEELKEKITALTRYIEPAMIVVMGILIGGVALAMLLPIFTISRVMAH